MLQYDFLLNLELIFTNKNYLMHKFIYEVLNLETKYLGSNYIQYL